MTVLPFLIALLGTPPLSLDLSQPRYADGLLSLTPVFRARYGRPGRWLALRPARWTRTDAPGGGVRLSTKLEHRLVGVDLAWSATPGDPRLRLEAEVRYHQSVVVDREVLELRSRSGESWSLRRDLRLKPVPLGVSRVGAWTPKVLTLAAGPNRISLLGDDNFGSLEVQRGRIETVIGLEMDHAGNHPFSSYRCTRTRRSAGAGIGKMLAPGERAPRLEDRSRQRRRSGEVRRFHAVFYRGNDHRPFGWLGRLPAPYRAALVFVDHADQGSLGRLEGLTFPEGGGGFGGRKLPFTKTVFWKKRGRGQLTTDGYQALAKRLVAAGTEVGPHTVTDGTDSRETTQRGLEAFRALGAATWVDHAPLTNCETLMNSGARRSSRFYIIDLLRNAGFRYAWSGKERDSPGLNILAPELPWSRRQLFYPHDAVDRGKPPLWIFPTQWAFVRRERMLAMYSDYQLARLVEQRGVHLAHTYLDFHAPGTRLAPRTLLDRAHGRYTIRPDFDERLAAMSRLRRAGKLWVTTVRELGDFLRKRARVEVSVSADRSLLLWNRGSTPISGLQILSVVALDGGATPSRQTRDGFTTRVDIPAGGSTNLKPK